MLDVATSDCGDNVGQSRAGSDQRKCTLALRTTLIEVLRTDSCGNLMHNRNALEPPSKSVEEMHDTTTCHEEAVRISQFNEPDRDTISVLHEGSTLAARSL
jgi:hypothetical protein